MHRIRLRRALGIFLLSIAALAAAGYLARDFLFFTFLYSGTRADWELSEIRRESDAMRHGLRGGQISATERSLMEQAIALADENPGTRAELGALYFVASRWPETPEGKHAEESLIRQAGSVDLEQLAGMLERSGVERGTHPELAAILLERVKRSPDHPRAGLLLAEASVLLAPHGDAAEPPPQFVEAANLIRDRYAASPDIVHFCESLGEIDFSPSWVQPFEPHLRSIIEVNRDRFVRCTAKFRLALLVQSSGEYRQPEAERLLEQFLAEFDGTVRYPASAIEQMYRQSAQRQLEVIRSHGFGRRAPEISGLDLDGRPMALAEYRGKVVLVSFWATWCLPCMRTIPHENRLVERFAADEFAIVGVNSDADLSAARTAVEKHGIQWRSFRNEVQGHQEIADRWKVVGYPTLYLLDRNGIVRKRWMGKPSPDELETCIKRLIVGLPAEKTDASEAIASREGKQSAPRQNEYAPIEVLDDASGATGFVAKIYRSEDGKEHKYVLFIPHRYEHGTRTPAILFLHGSGLKGTDGRKPLRGALADAVRRSESDFPFIVIFPQAEENWRADTPDGRRAIAILDEVCRNYAVDPSRIYLTGFSMGGEGTWSLAAAHPDRWAAIVPICGGGDPSQADKIREISCWCFHGGADWMIPPLLSQRMVRAVREAGGRPMYHEYPDVGHNCWDLVYGRPDLYEWLLDQSRL